MPRSWAPGLIPVGTPQDGSVLYFDAGAWHLLDPGDDGDHLELAGGLPTWSPPTLTQTLVFVISGGGSTITTGVKGDLPIDYPCTITGVQLLADQSGSIVVDLWVDSYANYPPTGADSICGAAKPTIAAATKSKDTTLTGWDPALTAGDTIRFNVDSATSITRVTVALTVTRAL